MNLSRRIVADAIPCLIGAIVLLVASACTVPSNVPRQQASIHVPLSIAEDGPCCGPITPNAQHVLDVLDTSNVEHLWQQGTRVAWDTGEPTGGEEVVDPYHHHTHCSAFAASMGQRLGVYMLRPPYHKQELLATAQTEWFASGTGKDVGWWRVDSPEQAQALANSGRLVVVAFPSPDPHMSGHIAVVRPDARITLARIRESGPEVTQAGNHNHLHTTVKRGFSSHHGAWPNGVMYFAHDLPDQPPAQAAD